MSKRSSPTEFDQEKTKRRRSITSRDAAAEGEVDAPSSSPSVEEAPASLNYPFGEGTSAQAEFSTTQVQHSDSQTFKHEMRFSVSQPSTSKAQRPESEPSTSKAQRPESEPSTSKAQRPRSEPSTSAAQYLESQHSMTSELQSNSHPSLECIFFKPVSDQDESSSVGMSSVEMSSTHSESNVVAENASDGQDDDSNAGTEPEPGPSGSESAASSDNVEIPTTTSDTPSTTSTSASTTTRRKKGKLTFTWGETYE